MQKNGVVTFLLAGLLVFSGFAGPASGGGPGSRRSEPNGGNVNDQYAPFLINNIFNYYGNNGEGSYNRYAANNEGFEFLKGANKHLFNGDGVLWGGFHKGRPDPKVGGSAYLRGLQAGPLVTYGSPSSEPVAADPADPKQRIYRVRRDVTPRTSFASVESSLTSQEVPYIGRYESKSAQTLYDEYVWDWNEWPAAEGAPFAYGAGADGRQRSEADGPYDPRYDTPGIAGADQTLWFAANDMNSQRTLLLSGSTPIGLEMQRTIWGYRSAGALGITIFIRTRLINKSSAPVDSMYLLQWADPDIGQADDDYVGCDTSRNLGYGYNSPHFDAIYEKVVPAGGFALLQGPRVPSPGDSAIFDWHYRKGWKNLPMTAFTFSMIGNEHYADPEPGIGADIQWYRLMHGTTASAGSPYVDPTTGKFVRRTLYGDPVKSFEGAAGWVDGLGGLPAGDRRFAMASGPFTLAAGDTQELIMAQLGGAGSDRLSSVAVLRTVADRALQQYWSMVRDPGTISTASGQSKPLSFELAQNYPNPFNPSTVISFRLPVSAQTSLRVYDVTGREVATLLEGLMHAGRHELEWKPGGVASGVYLYKLEVMPQDGYGGSVVQSRKMIYIR